MELSETNKGKPIAILKGFAYLNDKTNENTHYWRCSQFYSHSCKARIITKLIAGEQKYSKSSGEHNHPPSATEKSKRDAVRRLKNVASTSRDPPSGIVNQVHSTLNRHELAALPSTSAQKQVIRRIRKEDSESEPTSLSDLIIPQDIMQNIGGGAFVIADIFEEGERIIIMSSPESMEILSKSDIIIMDGTFFVVPSMFYQLYSLFGMAGVGSCRRAFPLVHVLMTKKTISLYRKLFQEIKSYYIKEDLLFEPKHFLTDFEQAAVKACKIEFPSSESHGCLFHFGQIVYRAIVRKGLRTIYGEDQEFASNIRKLIALAFLDPDEIPDAFEDIILWMSDDPKVTEFVEWFRRNYISQKSYLGSQSQNQSQSLVRFPEQFWSINTLVRQGLPRTQNSVEGWHRRIRVLIGNAHPGVYTLMRKLREEVHYQSGQIDRANRDEKTDCTGRKYSQREKEILAIFDAKNTFGMSDFLFALSQKVKNLIDV